MLFVIKKHNVMCPAFFCILQLPFRPHRARYQYFIPISPLSGLLDTLRLEADNEDVVVPSGSTSSPVQALMAVLPCHVVKLDRMFTSMGR